MADSKFFHPHPRSPRALCLPPSEWLFQQCSSGFLEAPRRVLLNTRVLPFVASTPETNFPPPPAGCFFFFYQLDVVFFPVLAPTFSPYVFRNFLAFGNLTGFPGAVPSLTPLLPWALTSTPFSPSCCRGPCLNVRFSE